MKRVDMTNIRVVCAGEDWLHSLPPCSREMMRYLERNERLVSWLQPVNGAVQDQVPAIRVKDSFFTISLRMMKAIWRHVRLKKGFENIERAPYGGLKLKIPVSLLAEKLRTQSRFNVSYFVLKLILIFPKNMSRCVFWVCLFTLIPVQVMRMSTVVKERKVSQSAPSKIDSIVKQLFLPMLVMPTPAHTSFQAEDGEELVLRQVAQDRPGALENEQAFVDYMVVLYRRFQSGGGSAHSGAPGEPGAHVGAVSPEVDLQIGEGVADLVQA